MKNYRRGGLPPQVPAVWRIESAGATAWLKPLWKKLVRMFPPDLHDYDPEKRKTYELHDVKSYDRIMDGRIIIEDDWIR